ncbi:MAG: histidine phosphatase family protein [Proteobacteria bacterium]|nr:histidine phosphatase family protein [Pseudomonadota bacterium]
MKANKSFRLILLRHGNTFNANEIAVQVGCKTDLPLTEKGLVQAEQFLKHLKQQQLSPSLIYCGTLQRQTQTANLLKNAFSGAILKTQTQALNEIDYGLWEGLTAQEIEAKWPLEYQQWQEQAIWPEHVFHSSFSSHNHALKEWLKELNDNASQNDLIVAVSSNGIFRLLLQWLPELWQKLVKERKVDSFKVGTGHYCLLTINANLELNINAWNCKPGDT